MSSRHIPHHSIIKYTCDVCGEVAEIPDTRGYNFPASWMYEANIGDVCPNPECLKRVEEFRREYSDWHARRVLVEKEANCLRNQHVQAWAEHNPEPKIKP